MIEHIRKGDSELLISRKKMAIAISVLKTRDFLQLNSNVFCVFGQQKKRFHAIDEYYII